MPCSVPSRRRVVGGVAALAVAVGGLLPAATSAPAAAAPAPASAASASAARVPSVTALPVLRYGSRGVAVQRVQRILGVRPLSGWFGPRTRAAVRQFQARNRLTVNGIVASRTWAALLRAETRAGRSQPENASDVTRTALARASRQHRATISVAQFLASPSAQRVVRRESGGRCNAVNPSGKYRGKWQMDRDFWRSYGGLAYASTPDRATCGEQDIVAWRGWVARWWQPWGG